MIRDEFGSIPVPDQRRPRPAFEVPDHPDTLFAIATDPEATDDDGRRSTTCCRCASRSTVGAYRQRQVERLYTGMLNARLSELDDQAGPAVHAGRHRARHLRPHEGSRLADGARQGGRRSRAGSPRWSPSRRARRGSGSRRANSSASGATSCAATRARSPNATRRSRPTWPPSSSARSPQQEPTPGMTYEYGLVQRFVPAITLDEVNKVAREWASGSRVVLVNAPKKPGLALPGEAQLAAAMKARLGRRHQAVRGRRRHAAADGAAAEARLRRHEHDQGPLSACTEWELSNGVKVVLMPTTFKQDEVIFRATSPGGTSLASDKDFVAATTAAQVIARRRRRAVQRHPAPERAGRQGRVRVGVHRRHRRRPRRRRVAEGPGDDVPADLPDVHPAAGRRRDVRHDDGADEGDAGQPAGEPRVGVPAGAHRRAGAEPLPRAPDDARRWWTR